MAAVKAKWRHRRTLCRLAAAWLTLTTASAVAHWIAWIAPPGTPGLAWILGSSYLKPIVGMAQVATAPVWWIIGRVTGVAATKSTVAETIAFGLGWAAWLAIAAGAIGLRTVLMRSGRREAPDVPGARAAALSRRRFLVDGTGITLAALPAAAIGSSTLVCPWSIRLRRYSVAINGLNPALAGFRLVQISDTHLGPRIPAWHIANAVRLAVDLKPDAFVLTGDYIHQGRRYIAPAADLFRPLVGAGRPVVAVLGNHDWYGSGPEVRAAMEACGVVMVDNGRIGLAPGGSLADPRDAALVIAGVGDLLEDTVDWGAALRGIDRSTPRLVLSHNPDVVEAVPAGERVDLILSGHTHGGQVRLPLLGTPIVPSAYGSRYAGGLVRGPACPVVISRGVGMSIVPVRWGVPPEVVEITLGPA